MLFKCECGAEYPSRREGGFQYQPVDKTGHTKLTCKRCREFIVCNKCGIKALKSKAHELFDFRHQSSPTGFQYSCRECRREQNKQYGRTSKAKQQIKENATERAAKRGGKRHRDHAKERQDRLLKQLAEKLVAKQAFGETSRTFHFALKTILEQQLDLFYGRTITSPIGASRKRKIVDEALYEIQGVLSRVVQRMKLVEKAEPASELDDLLPGEDRERGRALSVLGLTSVATPAEIKKRYKELARSAHPDHGGSEERMAEINAAWSKLER